MTADSDNQAMRQFHHAAARSAGFTLVEVMVVVVVIAILTMIALPAYNESVRKGRRSEAFVALTAVQQAQERYRGSNTEYADTMTELGASTTTPNGYYTISVEAPAADDGTISNGYVAIATAVSGTTQADDAACSTVAVRLLGGTLSYAGCGGSCGSLAFTESHACWVR
jgi:type IV pilus assembly protein PilE